MAKATPEWRQNYYIKRMNEYKLYLGGKCIKCDSYENLQFDHKNPDEKCFEISIRYDATWEILKPELDKCQLLCQTCHMIKGQEEGDTRPAAQHGTLGMHRHHKCRCNKCKEAFNSYMRDWKRNRRISLSGKGPHL